MGNKPSNTYAMDRPESGGADHNDERENSGLLDRAKQEFAESQKAKRSKPEGDPATKRSNKPKRPKT
jgi:hypothetical protein